MTGADDLDVLIAAQPARPSTPDGARRRTLRIAGIAMLAAWAAVALVAMATMMGPHWVTLPRPIETDSALVAGLGALRPEGRRAMLAVHVLYSECRCSRRILDHLLARDRVPGVNEVILFVGSEGSMAQRARARGWTVAHIGRRELESRLHIVSVPMMAVLGSDDRVLHLGGYTRRKQGPAIQDVAILTSLTRGAEAEELPLFGCATGLALSRELDPLGIRTVTFVPTEPE